MQTASQKDLKDQGLQRCYMCDTVKPFSDFYFDRNENRLLRRCRRCDGRRKEASRKRNGYFESDKYKARATAKEAEKSGKLVRQPCEVCGVEQVHGHHYKGYEKENWLDIQWLCRKHHLEAHGQREVI